MTCNRSPLLDSKKGNWDLMASLSDPEHTKPSKDLLKPHSYCIEHVNASASVTVRITAQDPL